jgi:hypothetical protein
MAPDSIRALPLTSKAVIISSSAKEDITDTKQKNITRKKQEYIFNLLIIKLFITAYGTSLPS